MLMLSAGEAPAQLLLSLAVIERQTQGGCGVGLAAGIPG